MTDSVRENNRRMLHELLDIAINTNGFEARKREETGNLPTVFFFICGHTADVTFSINKDGWVAGEEADYRTNIYFDEEISKEKVEEVRAECMSALADKDENAVLRRDIERKEAQLEELRASIHEMRKDLEKRESHHEADT